MRDYFRTLFAHDHWANRELFSALNGAENVPARAQALCGHIVATHRFWELRLAGTHLTEFDFWPQLTLADCAAQNEAYGTKWPRFLMDLPEPFAEQRVTYRGFDGKKQYTFLVTDILTQLHGHGEHHRAQVLALMREAKLERPNLDYIRYCLKSGRVTTTDL